MQKVVITSHKFPFEKFGCTMIVRKWHIWFQIGFSLEML